MLTPSSACHSTVKMIRSTLFRSPSYTFLEEQAENRLSTLRTYVYHTSDASDSFHTYSYRPATNGMTLHSLVPISRTANLPWPVISRPASPRASSSLSVSVAQLARSVSPRIPRQNRLPPRSGTCSSAEAVPHVPSVTLFLTGTPLFYLFFTERNCAADWCSWLYQQY